MPPQQGQCPYCQLIDNPSQLLVVAETDNFYAWLEVNPRAKGHTQIVPKEHTESIMELDFEKYQEAMKLVRMVMEKAFDGLDADGVSVTMNVKEAGGQMLPHAYISVFPRFQEEENAGTPTGAIFRQREELQQDLESIQGSMESVTVQLEEETHEPHPDSQNFKDRTVDRNKLEDKAEKEESGEKKEVKTQENAEEPGDQKEEKEASKTRESDEEEDELEGTGHWDGKSFEWR